MVVDVLQTLKFPVLLVALSLIIILYFDCVVPLNLVSSFDHALAVVDHLAGDVLATGLREDDLFSGSRLLLFFFG